MTEPKYKIGQKLWLATHDGEEISVTCPDCGGTGQIHCRLFDGTELSVECAGCTRGYHGPQGRLYLWARKPRASSVEIIGMEVEAGKITYRTSGSVMTDEANLFLNQEDAVACAQEIAAQHDSDDLARALNKEKPTRSWSWHVHYHRRCIRDAEKQIAYHAGKLNVAKLKAKEPA